MPGIKQGKPRVPETKVPIIGEQFTDREKKLIDAAIKSIAKQMEPILNGIGQALDGALKEIEVLREVKKIFPDKVEVTVKHEHTIAEALQQESILKGVKEKK